MFYSCYDQLQQEGWWGRWKRLPWPVYDSKNKKITKLVVPVGCRVCDKKYIIVVEIFNIP